MGLVSGLVLVLALVVLSELIENEPPRQWAGAQEVDRDVIGGRDRLSAAKDRVGMNGRPIPTALDIFKSSLDDDAAHSVAA